MTATVPNLQRASVVWVKTDEVIPNPLNPRKNDAIKTEEMQEIILKRGWEIPLTVYKKGRYYVVLAGHRRLYAAKQAKIPEIPVYVTETPEDHQEEIERIASLQRGTVDWTPYEWGKFTYDRWVAWGRPAINDFAKEINMTKTTAKGYITVLSYYKTHEIQAELENGTYTMSVLEELYYWISAMRQHQSSLMEDMTEDMIRKVMLNKIANKQVTRDSLRTRDLLKQASKDDIREFLLSRDLTLTEVCEMYGLGKRGNKRTFHGHLVAIGMFEKNISEMKATTQNEAEKGAQALKDLSTKLRRMAKDMLNAEYDN